MFGAVQVAVAEVAFAKLPEVCPLRAQEYETLSFALPDKVAWPPETILLSGPALAVGAVFAATVS